MITTNLPIIGRTLRTSYAVGVLPSVQRAVVASLNIHVLHADQAVCFPSPANDDVTSLQVKAWNAGSAMHLSSPRA
jgi:hypothetical protein